MRSHKLGPPDKNVSSKTVKQKILKVFENSSEKRKNIRASTQSIQKSKKSNIESEKERSVKRKMKDVMEAFFKMNPQFNVKRNSLDSKLASHTKTQNRKNEVPMDKKMLHRINELYKQEFSYNHEHEAKKLDRLSILESLKRKRSKSLKKTFPSKNLLEGKNVSNDFMLEDHEILAMNNCSVFQVHMMQEVVPSGSDGDNEIDGESDAGSNESKDSFFPPSDAEFETEEAFDKEFMRQWAKIRAEQGLPPPTWEEYVALDDPPSDDSDDVADDDDVADNAFDDLADDIFHDHVGNSLRSVEHDQDANEHNFGNGFEYDQHKNLEFTVKLEEPDASIAGTEKSVSMERSENDPTITMRSEEYDNDNATRHHESPRTIKEEVQEEPPPMSDEIRRDVLSANDEIYEESVQMNDKFREPSVPSMNYEVQKEPSHMIDEIQREPFHINDELQSESSQMNDEIQRELSPMNDEVQEERSHMNEEIQRDPSHINDEIQTEPSGSDYSDGNESSAFEDSEVGDSDWDTDEFYLDYFATDDDYIPPKAKLKMQKRQNEYQFEERDHFEDNFVDDVPAVKVITIKRYTEDYIEQERREMAAIEKLDDATYCFAEYESDDEFGIRKRKSLSKKKNSQQRISCDEDLVDQEDEEKAVLEKRAERDASDNNASKFLMDSNVAPDTSPEKILEEQPTLPRPSSNEEPATCQPDARPPTPETDLNEQRNTSPSGTAVSEAGSSAATVRTVTLSDSIEPEHPTKSIGALRAEKLMRMIVPRNVWAGTLRTSTPPLASEEKSEASSKESSTSSKLSGARRRKQGMVKKKNEKEANEMIVKEWDCTFKNTEQAKPHSETSIEKEKSDKNSDHPSEEPPQKKIRLSEEEEKTNSITSQRTPSNEFDFNELLVPDPPKDEELETVKEATVVVEKDVLDSNDAENDQAVIESLDEVLIPLNESSPVNDVPPEVDLEPVSEQAPMTIEEEDILLGENLSDQGLPDDGHQYTVEELLGEYGNIDESELLSSAVEEKIKKPDEPVAVESTPLVQEAPRNLRGRKKKVINPIKVTIPDTIIESADNRVEESAVTIQKEEKVQKLPKNRRGRKKLIVEPTVDPITEHTVEPDVDVNAQSVEEKIMESTDNIPTDQGPTEASPESVVESILERHTEPASERVAEPVVHTVDEEVVESVTSDQQVEDIPTSPQLRRGRRKKIVESDPVPVVEPVVEHFVDPIFDSVVEPEIEPAVVVEPIVQQTNEQVVESIAEVEKGEDVPTVPKNRRGRKKKVAPKRGRQIQKNIENVEEVVAVQNTDVEEQKEEANVEEPSPPRKRTRRSMKTEETPSAPLTRSTRSKPLFLSKNNPVPRIRQKSVDSARASKTPIRVTGVATMKQFQSPRGTPEKLRQLPNALREMIELDSADEEEEVVDAVALAEAAAALEEPEIKEEVQDENDFLPPPINEFSRKSIKRVRNEKHQQILEGIKQEITGPIDDECQVTMAKFKDVKNEEQDNEITVIEANYNVESEESEEVEPEVPPARILPDGYKSIVLKNIYDGINELFNTDPEQFCKLSFILAKDTEKKGRAFKECFNVTDRCSAFDEKFIRLLASNPKKMAVEERELSTYTRFAATFRDKASHLLKDHQLTPFMLYQVIEKLTEIKEDLEDNCDSKLIGSAEHDILLYTEQMIAGEYISAVFKMTELSQVTYAVEVKLKRRLELLYNGWKMFLKTGGFFRVMLAIDREDVKPMSEEFRKYCTEYLAGIDSNFAKAVEIFNMPEDELYQKIVEESKITPEQEKEIMEDMRSEESASHSNRCAKCYEAGQLVVFSTYRLLGNHEQLHYAETEDCFSCYNLHTPFGLVFHRINNHFSIRPMGDF